ncbi:hypothetical protein [Microbispora bryophytorum]|uniref:hypothetical protein n=1 Tax=Microbispora bryophytorum TaxID=1460882 RepID=UPI003711A7E4
MSRRTEGGKEQSVRRRRGRLDDERPLTRRPESRRREVRVLYVACEGESTEPDYLQYLNEQFGDGDGRERQPFRIQPVYRKNGMTPSQVVEAARAAAGPFRDYDKRGDKSIKGPRRDALKGLEHKAVARARSLIASCPQGECAPARTEPDRAGRDAQPLPSNQWAARSGHAQDCPILRRDPSTDVWCLLVALGIV